MPAGRHSRDWRGAAALMARLFPGRDDARAFIAEALDDTWRTLGWRGVVRCGGTVVRDAIAIRMRPAALPLTAARRTTMADAVPSIWRIVMDHFLRDIQFGLRQLARQPLFAAAAIVTMALGVGANTAIFSVAWQTMLKPLPYPQRERLVEIWETFGTDAQANLSMPAKFRDWQREARSLDLVAAFGGMRGSVDLTGGGEPEQLSARRVTGDYFKVFGLAPLVGRTLDERDVTDGTGAVVLSEGLWRRRFQGRRDIVGVTIHLDGVPGTVVGVMPESFEAAAGRVDAWTTMTLPPETGRLRAHYLRVVGRLAPGVTIEQADAEIKAIAARAAKAYPDSDGKLSAVVRSIDGQRSNAGLRSGLVMLALAAAAVLLIACANLASLQLARGVSRAREFGIRAALGASRVRVMQQLVTEGLVIAILGAVCGLLLGAWVLRGLASVAPAAIRVAAGSRPDAVVIGYAILIAALSAVVFALAPAWRAADSATRWLRQRAESGDRRSARMRLVLVAGQIGAAIVLLVGAALLQSSLINVMRVDPGFKPEGALTFDVSVPPAKFDTHDKRAQLIDTIATSVAALPGVRAVCTINQIPLDTQGNMTYVPDGQTRVVGSAPRTVTPACFEALGMRLTRGRPFGTHEAGRVAIVSESFARAAWGRDDPIGKRVHEGLAAGQLIEIVGVVADALQASLEEAPFPQLYEAWTPGASFWPSTMVVRADVAPESLFGPLRAAVRRVDPDQPVAQLRTLSSVVAQSVAGRRFDLTLLVSFSAVALVLAAIGMYGLLSQIVAQRSPEIGVRLALGAAPGSVVRLIMRQAVVALAAGLPLGLAVAGLASSLLHAFMFGLSETDPRVYAAVAMAMAVVVVGAAWVPARRAASVDPASALRR